MRCEQAGIAKEKLLLDPGFGFGKNLSHNYQLLAVLGEFHHFGLPLLVGMSRKSMVGQLLNVGPSERLNLAAPGVCRHCSNAGRADYPRP